MKRFSSLLIACMCVFMLVGCQSPKNNSYKNTEEPYHYFQDYSLKFNEKLVYNICNENLGIYNMDSNKWEPIYNQDNLFAYDGNEEITDKSFFSIGSSTYNNFSIAQQEGTVVSSIMDVNKNDSCIPIGIYNNQDYFIYNANDLSGNETRKIVYLNQGKFVDVYDLKSKFITSAVFVDDELFYTYYVEDKDIYCLCSYNVKTKQNKAVKNIDTDEIYRLNDSLVYVDKENNLKNLREETILPLEKNAELRILSDYDLALKIYINNSNFAHKF